MSEAPPTVVVIDDDSSVREALRNLLSSVGLRVELFGSVQEFVASEHPVGPTCLVLDVRLPGKSGLDFLDEMKKTDTVLPVIFITGFADVPMSVRAMKAGAVEFLTKPFRDQDLLDAIQAAIGRDRVRRQKDQNRALLQKRYESLTGREQEVMALVVAGRRNKQIASALGLSEVTVKAHRSKIMQKMGVGSVVELVRAADKVVAGSPKS
jgi:FixJ family two-component response regulator